MAYLPVAYLPVPFVNLLILSVNWNTFHILHQDGHYVPFSDAFEVVTSEEHRPSFKRAQPKPKKKRKLPYYATVQHVKNANLTVQCS